FAGMLPPLMVAVSALSIGMGAMQPSLNSLISRRAGAEEQGEVMGIAQSVGSLARVLGPIIAGALFEGFGRNSPSLWAAALIAGKLVTVPVPLLHKEGVEASPGPPAAHAIAVPVEVILAYGLARVLSQGCSELRNAVFAKVGQRAVRRIAVSAYRHIHSL